MVSANGGVGIYHAIIRVGSGLEFGLPALVAEGLSLAASSGEWPAEFLRKAEKEARAAKVGLYSSIEA